MTRWLRGLALAALAGALFLVMGCSSSEPAALAGAITGRVAAPAGDTATVSVDGVEQSVPVNADGSFRLTCPPGVHTLVAQGANGSKAEAMVVEVPAGGETAVGEIALRDAGQVAGLVTDAETHAPLAGAVVTITQLIMTFAPDDTPRPVRTARTNPQGSYVVAGLPVGSYVLSANARGYGSVTREIMVNAGATTPGDAALTRGATATGALEGTVSLASANGTLSPLSGVLVSLHPPLYFADGGKPASLPPHAARPDGSGVDFAPTDPTQRPAYAYTDENGRYRIEGVVPGPYLAEAVRPGLEPVSVAVTIVADQTATADFTLKLAAVREGIVQGTVTDVDTKAPIAGAVVYAVYQPRPIPMADGSRRQAAGGGMMRPDAVTSAVTDAQGRYQLVVPAEIGALSVQARGYTPAQVPVTVTPGATVTVDVALKTIGVGVVEGTVVGMADGAPLAGVIVRALPYMPPMPLTATNTDAAMPPPEGPMTRTDANGHYTLKAPADITTLSFEAAGFQASYRPVQVQPDATVTVDVRLAPIVEGKFTLKGRVLAAPGGPAAPRPVPGATVYAAPAGPWDGPVVMDANRPMMVFTATTDRQGIYTFTLPAGAYTLSAQKDNFSSDAVRVELFRDAVQDLVLQTPVVVPMGGG